MRCTWKCLLIDPLRSQQTLRLPQYPQWQCATVFLLFSSQLEYSLKSLNRLIYPYRNIIEINYCSSWYTKLAANFPVESRASLNAKRIPTDRERDSQGINQFSFSECRNFVLELLTKKKKTHENQKDMKLWWLQNDCHMWKCNETDRGNIDIAKAGKKDI